MKFNEIEYISELIFHKINGRITAEETKALESWASQSRHNRSLVERYENPEVFSRSTKHLDSVAAHIRFVHRVEQLKRQQRVVRWTVGSAVAAAVIAACIVWFPFQRSHDTVAQRTAQVLLTLADGNKITLTEGESSVVANSSESNICLAGDKQIPLPASENLNTIQVPRAGEYALTLSDGSRVWLNSESSLSFPARFSGRERRVKVSGELYFEVAHDSSHPFIVETDRGDIEVLGTSFNVNNYADQLKTLVTLLTGSVKFTSPHGVSLLTPGQRCVVDTKSQSVETVNVEEDVAWHHGFFVFRAMTLNEVARQLERSYDVSFSFRSEIIKQHVYDGRILRFDSIDPILTLLETTGDVHFERNGQQITVTEK